MISKAKKTGIPVRLEVYGETVSSSTALSLRLQDNYAFLATARRGIASVFVTRETAVQLYRHVIAS